MQKENIKFQVVRVSIKEFLRDSHKAVKDGVIMADGLDIQEAYDLRINLLKVRKDLNSTVDEISCSRGNRPCKRASDVYYTMVPSKVL